MNVSFRELTNHSLDGAGHKKKMNENMKLLVCPTGINTILVVSY